MNRSALLAAFVFALALMSPRLALASATASAACSTATIGDFYCTCDTGTTTLDGSGDTEEACNDSCEALDATSWLLESCQASGSGVDVVSENTGNVTGESDGTYTDAAATAKEDSIAPDLNVDIPGLDPTKDFAVSSEDSNIASNFIGIYITKVYSWLIGAAALIAVTMMMIGGLQYAMARGKAGYIDKAKKRISNAVTGLVLLLAAYNIAFLINPDLVVFDSLTIPYVKGLEYFPAEGEDTDVVENTSLTGQTVPISGDYLIGSGQTIDAEMLTALQAAAKTFHDTYDHNIVVSSAFRPVEKQAKLFYDNCIKTGGTCSVPTCNPASSSVVLVSKGKYSLTGVLSGVTNGDTAVAGITANANFAACPHTSGVAIDLWCDDGGSNYQHDPGCQDQLIRTMVTSGFCRLTSEVWHFELQSKKLSKNCLQSNGRIGYTTKKGDSYAPGNDCKKWDFKQHRCVVSQ